MTPGRCVFGISVSAFFIFLSPPLMLVTSPCCQCDLTISAFTLLLLNRMALGTKQPGLLELC